MKKRSIFLFIFLIFVIFFSFSVLAFTGVCADNQTILKLSSETNAHAALYSSTDYSYRICFNEIFGREYPSNPARTGTTNIVIRLTSETNAHAAQSSSLPVPVSYGDLSCRAVETGNCEADEKPVLYLSSLFNAHLSGVPGASYPVKICCSSPSTPLTHTECEMVNGQAECVTKPGIGLIGQGCVLDSQCTSPNPQYYRCSSGGVCERKDGHGENNCNPLIAECTYEEDKNVCEVIQNPPTDICANIIGTGVDECTTATVAQCSSDQCPVGQSWCGNDEGCKVPPCESPVQCTNDGTCSLDESCNCADCLGQRDHCAENLVCTNQGVEGSCQPDQTTVRQITDPHWTNVAGDRTAQSCINNTVHMVAQTNYSAGTVVNYTVYEKDAVVDDKVKDSLTAIVDSTGKVSFSVKIDDEYAQAAGGALEGGQLEFYFNSFVGQVSNLSGTLYVNKTACGGRIQGNNTLPVANITSPKHAQVYFTNTEIEFNETSYDRDGQINSYDWEIVNETGGIEFASTSRTFNHNFTTTGTKIIKLNVIDNRNGIDEDEIGIVVLGFGENGTGNNRTEMFVYIEDPEEGERVIDYGLEVNFSAKESYVIYNNLSSDCTGNLTCLAGKCPLIVGDVLPGVCYILGRNELNVIDAPRNYQTLLFNWSFYDIDETQKANLTGYNLASGVTRYPSISNNDNDKAIFLILKYADSSMSIDLESSILRLFNLARGSPPNPSSYCQMQNGINTGDYIKVNSTGTFIIDNCRINSGTTCCAAGDVCGTNGQCTPNPNPSPVNGCARFTTQNTCQNAHINTASELRRDPAWNTALGVGCDTYTDRTGTRQVSCVCSWNAGTCKLNATMKTNFIDDKIGSCIPGNCLISSNPTSECVEGFQSIQIVSNFLPSGDAGMPATCLKWGIDYTLDSASCSDSAGETTASCEAEPVELPFFNMFNLIISGMTIFVIYALYLGIRKKA